MAVKKGEKKSSKRATAKTKKTGSQTGKKAATKSTVKQTVKKGAAKKPAERKMPDSKITLPAFGLAEEILGSHVNSGGETEQAVGKTAPEKTVKGASGGRGREYSARAAKAVDSKQSGAGLLSGGKDQRSPDTESKERDSGPQLHLVTYNIDREEYGVDIDRVQEIIRVGLITPVPNSPEYIRGVINLRGKIIPVLDLRKRLEIPEGALTKNSRVMVVEPRGKVLGLLVDAVQQVLWMPVASVESPPDEVEKTRAYVKGIGKIDSRLIMLMDLDKVLEKEMPITVG